MSDAPTAGDDGATDDPTEPTDDPIIGLDTTPYSTLESALPGDRTALNSPPEHWEAVGRRVLASHLDLLLDDLHREVRETAVACRHGGAVTSDHVTRLRDAVEVLELTLEESVVPLTAGAEPWERTPGRVPVGRLREALDLDRSEVRALRELRGD